MNIRMRHEVTIEIKDNLEAAKKAQAYYESIGYITFEESDEWIQLDRGSEVSVAEYTRC